jgi:hypothetical protein
MAGFHAFPRRAPREIVRVAKPGARLAASTFGQTPGAAWQWLSDCRATAIGLDFRSLTWGSG